MSWNNLIPGINWWSVNAPPSPYPVLNLSLLFSLHHFNFLLIIFRKPLLCIRNDDNKPDLRTSSYNFLWTTSKWSCYLQFNSVQFSRSVVSDDLRHHESQHARPPCPSPTPGVCSDSRPSSQWCHPVISSSVVPFSFRPQSLPASESFPMSQLFAWGGQSTGDSALASFLPKNTQDCSPLEWTIWISLQSKGFSRVFSNTTVQKHQFFSAQLSSQSNSHIHKWPLEKP